MFYEAPSPEIDRGFYEDVRADKDSYILKEKHDVPPVTGKAVRVPAGHCVRLTCVEGAQIADVCFFNAENPKEHLWANQTLNREGACLTTFSRVWTNLPMFRPLMTIVEDTVVNTASGTTARHHSVLGAHCNPRFWQWARGTLDQPNGRDKNCYYNLVAAIQEFGLGREYVHDNLNLFQKMGIHPVSGQLVMEPSEAKPGDYVDFFAEMDAIVAVALCPQGSGKFEPSAWEQDPHAMRIEVFQTKFQPLPTDYSPV